MFHILHYPNNRPYNEELLNWYASLIRMIMSKKMRWVGCVARMGELKNAYVLMVENPKSRDRPEGLGLIGEIILEWILGNKGG
jgi:hypothetical protein